MGEPEPKGRNHYRGKARIGRRVELRYSAEDNGKTVDENVFTKNIGVGGAFLLTADPLPTGTKMTLSLLVPSRAEPLVVDGEVRWIVDGANNEPAAQHGMGVKFSGIAVDDLLLLNEYFSSLPEAIDMD